jgi:hypothetical protein
MAKRKRAALFEVIQKDKRFDRPGGAMAAPAWMFKGKPLPPVAAPAVLAAPPLASSVTRHIAPSNASLPDAVKGSMASGPLTRTSVAIIAGAAMVALSLGYVWFRWAHRSSSDVTNAQAVLSGPAHPEVMDIPVPRGPDRPAVLIDAAPSATPAASVQTPVRQGNLNYVRIRLYESQKSAAATHDLLVQHGIACTIEHNIPGVAMPLYAVVGLTPFATAGTTEYSAYIARIKAILTAGGDTRALSPRLIKWQGNAGRNSEF